MTILIFVVEIPEGTKQVCTTCFGRINKRISQLDQLEDGPGGGGAGGGDQGNTRKPGQGGSDLQRGGGSNADDLAALSAWSDNEVELLKIGLRASGTDWPKICESLPDKTGEQCKAFFYASRAKLHLDKIVKEYKKVCS